MTPIRRMLTLGALAIAATMVAPGVTNAAPGDPALVNGKKAGPVSIAVQQNTVASLALTKGRWLVIAKAVIAGTGGSTGAHLGVDCRLQVGSRSDLISAVPIWDDQEGSRVPVVLTTAGKLKGAGSALLRCAGEVGGAVKIRDIRMMAVKVGTLTTRSTATPAGASVGPSATSGSGKPVVISAKQGSPKAVDGSGTFRPVANLPLPQGRWWIIAKGVADSGVTSTTYRCGVNAGGDGDLVGFPLGSQGETADAMPFAIQVVHDFAAPGTAELVCLGNAAFQVRNVVINAI